MLPLVVMVFGCEGIAVVDRGPVAASDTDVDTDTDTDTDVDTDTDTDVDTDTDTDVDTDALSCDMPAIELGRAVGFLPDVGSTCGATDLHQEPCESWAGSVVSSPDLAFRWTAPADGLWTISAFLFDGVVTVLSCDPGTIQCTPTTPAAARSTTTLEMSAGQQVIVLVSESSGGCTDISMDIQRN